MAVGNGPILAETGGIDPQRFDAQLHESFAQRQGTALTERTIVFFGAAFIAMAIDFHGGAGIAFEVIRDRTDFGFFAGFYVRTIEVKMDGVLAENLCVTRPIFPHVGRRHGGVAQIERSESI